MIPNAFLEAETINSLAVRMSKINPKCDLSASALAQRMNSDRAKSFMKACFGKIISALIQKDLSPVLNLRTCSKSF